jgi:signal transduction histidine kinase
MPAESAIDGENPVFNSVRIHTKLAMALVVPLVALVGLSALVVVVSRNDASRARSDAEAVRAQVRAVAMVTGPSGLLNALQAERNGESMALLGIPRETMAQMMTAGDGSAGTGPALFRKPTDAAVADFRRSLAQQSPSVQQIYAPALAQLDKMGSVRADVDLYAGERGLANTYSTVVHKRYTDIIEAFFDAAVQVGSSVDDRTLRSALDILDLMARQKEQGTEVFRLQLLNMGTPSRSGTAEVAAEAAKVEQINAQVFRLAASTERYKAIIDTQYADANWLRFNKIISDMGQGNSPDLTELFGSAGSDAYASSVRLHDQLGAQLDRDSEQILATADGAAADADARSRSVLLGAVIVLAAAAAVALVASRSISRPLHRLADEAEEMGKRRLPEAVHSILETRPGEDIVMPELDDVPRHGGTEIAEVADALNSVQTSAAALAVEQAALRRNIAESFVNLGRRSQNLLSRQLDSISEMEQNETDPDMLERLFALDHLATRMRRNAESLLLLGGLEPQRQWGAPIPIADAVRAALGEVEDYTRVDIEHLDEGMVNGTAVTDVTHMLAELLENALVFSPDDTRVEIIGRGTGNSYTLTVVDHGPGMTPDELARSQHRISGDESYTLAPSRHLGHYVVGVQARRLGVVVTLKPAPDGGLCALLKLDAVLSAPALPPAAAPAAAGPAGAAPATWSQFADATAEPLPPTGRAGDAVTMTVSTHEATNATNRTTEVES